MELWHYTVLIVAVSTTAVLGLPGGAPGSACTNGLIPTGHTDPANMVGDDPFPYIVNISYIGDSYIPATNYSIILSGSEANADFRGFLIQAQTVAEDTAVGTFVVGGTDYQLLCDSNTGATHTSNDEKTMVTLTWTAPPFDTGAIVFRYTFVDRYSPSNMDNINRFWDAEMSAMISEAPTSVMFSESTYTVSEDAGPVQPELVISNELPNDLTVQVYNIDGSATGGDVDYTSGPYSVIFPAGMTRVTFSISINDDDDAEPLENFMIFINSTSPNISSIMIGDPSEATVTIVDDDATYVMFYQSTYTVGEGDGQVQPELVLSKPSEGEINVQVTSMDGTATGGEDYTSGPYTVTIPTGEMRMSFNISITDDQMFEPNETFALMIDTDSLPTNFFVGNAAEATVTIVDDDATYVTFSQDMYSVNENAGSAQPQVVISNPSATAITVQVTTTDGTATGGEDYASGPYPVIVPVNATTMSFNIAIINDTMDEGSEYFTLSIDQASLPAGFLVSDPNQARVTIRDDDGSTSTGAATGVAASSVMILLLMSIITIAI